MLAARTEFGGSAIIFTTLKSLSAVCRLQQFFFDWYLIFSFFWKNKILCHVNLSTMILSTTFLKTAFVVNRYINKCIINKLLIPIYWLHSLKKRPASAIWRANASIVFLISVTQWYHRTIPLTIKYKICIICFQGKRCKALLNNIIFATIFAWSFKSFHRNSLRCNLNW